MKFTKMHGAGNDYVYVNCFEETVNDPCELAKRVSDRHFGIGSDGLILIRPSQVADCWMDMYNADGSNGGMCGNGIRCVAKYAYEHGISRNNPMRIETGDGIKTIRLTLQEEKVTLVQVDMGRPRLTSCGNTVEPALTNREALGAFPIWETITVEGQEYQMIAIDVGNPHAIVFVDEVETLEIEKIGPRFENHERFPRRTNTEFIERVDRSMVKMRVWERGAGETLACGTGATATGVACALAGFTEPALTVRLLGGDLKIDWDQETGHVFMTGPATEVFTGEIEV